MTEMQDSTLVGYSCRHGIAEIVLNRPDKLNAISDELTVALREALRAFDSDGDARVGIIHGRGKAFSTGADVKQRQMRTRTEFERYGGPQHPDAHAGDLITRSVNCKPLIAAVHGYVLGLALGIALECELVVAETGTRFQITETPVGSVERATGRSSISPAARRSVPKWLSRVDISKRRKHIGRGSSAASPRPASTLMPLAESPRKLPQTRR